MKKQRRKIVPICYRKRSHSNSNTSLSQLLCIGSYKNRIKEVLKNNRSLAVNLQEARCLAATQSDIIKEYDRGYNKIMRARLKLQGMAKTITQLVTDLHDVVNCLDVNWASENNLFQNGNPHYRMKMISPDEDTIEEESAISSEKGDCGENDFSCSNAASNEVSSPKAPNIEERVDEILPSTPENITDVADDLDMPPILFVEDTNDNPGEKLSREHKSSRKSVVNQISLTPELDPDIYVWPKRRSSSRKQVIIPSAASSSRSNRRSSFCRRLSIERTTPKRGLESTAQRKLSLNLVNLKESCENESPDRAIFNTEECEVVSSSDLHCKKYSDQNEFSGCTFVNMKDRGSKNKNSSSPDIPEHFVDPNFPNVLHSEPVFASDSVNNNINNNVESNNTILPCEDMELTEIIRPVQLFVSENPSNTVENLLIHTVLNSNKPEKKEEIMGVQEIHSEDKLCNVTEQISVFKDVHRNVEEISCDSAKVSDCEETSRNTESVNKNPSESPVKSSRIKKRTYKVFFSSSESESDSTPIKSKSNKKKSDKDNRSTVIFKHKLSKRISDKEDKDVRADKSPTKNLQEDKEIENRYSVYDLDVSNSKKPLKKSKPRSKPKNSSCKKETSKPLLQNCNITKLPGVNYKFTKNKNPVNEKQKCQLLQNDSFISETNPAIHTDRTIKINQTYFTFDSTGLETEVQSKQASIPTRDELSSENTDLENHELCSKTSKLETRRVSFASVDLVCNFNKMSQARTIADNKKTLRTSKSAVDLNNFNQPPSETKDDALFETNKSSERTVETPHSPSNFNKMSQARTIADKKTLRTSKSAVNLDNFNQPPSETKDDALFETNKSSDGTVETPHSPSTLLNCSEETELYTFVLPVAEVENFSSDKTTASHHPTISDNSSNPNSKSSAKQKSGKLSLKRSKNCQNKPELDSCDKTDKDISFKLHHSQPSANSHQVLSNDSLDKSLEHMNSQTLEHPHKDVQIETQTSKKLHVTPVENNLLIPIDDIKISMKSSKKGRSSLKHKSPLPCADKTSKKNNTSKKFSGSSPVLKDLLNLEENSRQSMKRRSKVVNYKEPTLNKKMRRN